MTWRAVRFVRRDGVTIATEEVGDPEAPAIVLVCGAGSSKEWWDDEFCERLAKGGRRVIRFDLRDTGQSTTVPLGEATYTGTDLVDDLAAVIESLVAAPAHVYGVSLGGALAQSIAVRHPHLVASIVLQSTTPVGPALPGAAELPSPTTELLATFGAPASEPDWDDLDAVVAHQLAAVAPYAGTWGVDVEQVERAARRSVERGGPQRSGGNHFMVEDGPQVVDLDAVSVPTLVIHGDADPLFPLAHGEELARRIDGARLLVVPRLGHEYPPRASWDLIVPAVLANTAHASAG